MSHNVMRHMEVLKANRYITITKEEVYLSPDTKKGDVYKQRGGGANALHAPTAQGLGKLMEAAGIEIKDSKVRLVNPRLWEATLTGEYLQPDGITFSRPGTKEIDLRVGGSRWEKRREVERDLLLKKKGAEMGVFQTVKNDWGGASYKCKSEWVKAKHIDDFVIDHLSEEDYERIDRRAQMAATRTVNQAAQFGRELAETGAVNRATRHLLHVGLYTKLQLKEPFILIRARFDYEAMREDLPPMLQDRLDLARAGAATRLIPESAISGILLAPEATVSHEELETLRQAAESVNGEVTAEQAMSDLFGDNDDPLAYVKTEEPTVVVEEPKEEVAEEPEEEPVEAEIIKEPKGAFAETIEPELAQWLIEHYADAKFPSLASLIGYVLNKSIGVEALNHGEASNLRKFVEMVAALPEDANVNESKPLFKAKVQEANAVNEFWGVSDD